MVDLKGCAGPTYAEWPRRLVVLLLSALCLHSAPVPAEQYVI